MKKINLILALSFAFSSSAMSQVECPQQGDSRGDAFLNSQKNRPGKPRKENYQKDMTVDVFMQKFTPNLQIQKVHDKFPDLPNNPDVIASEMMGIHLIGYVLGVRQGGIESSNCHLANRRDFHIWIGAHRPRNRQETWAMRDHSVVAEPTPAGEDVHPN